MINKKRTKKLRSSKSSPIQISKRLGRKKEKIRVYPPKLAKRKLKKANRQFSFSEKFPLKTRIKVIGIGGGGGSIVSEIAKSLKKVSFVIADTDIRALKKNSGIKRFYFGRDLTHGLGTGMNPELAKESAERDKERIAKIFEDQDIVILVASLGGGVGSGATSIFAEIAQNSGSITLGFFTIPFKFEGEKKSKIANNSLQILRDALNVSVNIDNERIFKIINEKTSITEAFSVVNKNLIKSLESLIDTIYEPGLINIDFADIRTILKGRGKLAFLNTYQAGGKKGAEEIIKNIFNNPLYNYNLIAEKILFNISGGKNLSMVDVEKISKSISNLNPKAKIIFGISRSSKSKDKIKATLLVTGTSRFARSRPSGLSDEMRKEELRKEEVRKRNKKIGNKENKSTLRLRSGLMVSKVEPSKTASILSSGSPHQKFGGERNKIPSVSKKQEKSVKSSLVKLRNTFQKNSPDKRITQKKAQGKVDKSASTPTFAKATAGKKDTALTSEIPFKKEPRTKATKENPKTQLQRKISSLQGRQVGYPSSKTELTTGHSGAGKFPTGQVSPVRGLQIEEKAQNKQTSDGASSVQGRQKTISSAIRQPAERTTDREKTKIRRNALEIKKAEEIEESKKWAQEKEWEIPAFFRRIKD